MNRDIKLTQRSIRCGYLDSNSLVLQTHTVSGVVVHSFGAAVGRNRQDESCVCDVSLINVGNLKTDAGCATEFLCAPGWRTISTIVAGRAKQASAVLGCLTDQDNLPHSAFVVCWKATIGGVSRDNNNTSSY